MIGGSHHELSVAMQDYLKVLYELEEKGEPLTNSAVAQALDFSAASVSGMMKKLAEKDCVSYSPYRKIELTEKGRRVALELVRHHRIIELFLVKVLGMSWDEVHEEAEALEHVISEQVEASMARLMNDPKFDPHGHPIPNSLGEIEARPPLRPLAEVVEGERVKVEEVSDEDPEALRYLAGQGLELGTELEVTKCHPFEGPLEVATEEGSAIIGHKLAQMVGVSDVAG